MNYLFSLAYILSLIGLFPICQKAQKNINEPYTIRTDTLAIAAKLLTLSDAQKIMGEKAKLTGNTFIRKGDTLEYKCDYTALSQDAITGKKGTLYFMYEIYGGIPAAEKAYAAIYQANSKHEGIVVVSGLGDDAYYHSDQTGFYFFLIRKNTKLFRIKLNKVTSHSSEMEFKAASRRIVDKS